MPIYRLYLDASLEEGSTYSLPKEELHHLMRVLRYAPGDEMEVVNGKGRLAIARLEPSHHICVLHHQDFPNPYRRIVAQALPHRTKLDWIVEKGTELGMTELWLFPGVHSKKEALSSNQQSRLHHLSIAAIKQCGSLFLPSILLQPPIKEWSSVPCSAFFGSLDPAAPWLTPQEGDSILFIGPESGFAAEEIHHLQFLGAQGVHLHPHILRTETAVLVGLALLQNRSRLYS